MSEHTSGPWVVFVDKGTDAAIFTVMPAGRHGEIATNIENGADADLIAAAPDMLAALHHVRKIIVEAAETGFNCHDGDWAERLFASQSITFDAVRKAEGK